VVVEARGAVSDRANAGPGAAKWRVSELREVGRGW